MPLTFANSVTPERVRWLWPGYIPFGKVTVLDGDPGLGKSTILIDLAARLSRGVPLPNGKQHGPMGSILVMPEDEPADTTVPRLINAEADLGRVGLVDKYADPLGALITPRFPDHIAHLRQDIIDAEAGLVVIDPIMACLGTYNGAQISANSDQQVRDALMPLKDLAAETGAAIVLLRHLNKGSGTSALYRGGGSIAFVVVARSGLIVARDPDDEGRIVVASTKSNLGPSPPSLSYRLIGCDNGAARIAWEGHSSHTAETLVRTSDPEEHGAMQDAIAFLHEALANGPMLARTVQKQAREGGIADRTLRRAREALGIRRDSPYIKKATTQDGQFTWELPPAEKVAKGGGLDNMDNMATMDTYTQYTESGQSVHSGQSDQTTPVGHYHPDKASADPFSSVPVVTKTGRNDCAACGRERVMTAGQPMLCVDCRRALLRRTGTGDWD